MARIVIFFYFFHLFFDYLLNCLITAPTKTKTIEAIKKLNQIGILGKKSVFNLLIIAVICKTKFSKAGNVKYKTINHKNNNI
jgi:hypothetical protein